MPTYMPRGAGGAAGTVTNAALFREVRRGGDSFFDLLSAPAKTEGVVLEMMKKGDDYMESSSAEYPIVDITNLKKVAGDEVSVDLIHNRVIPPIMGDRNIDGRRGSTTLASNKFYINQFVFPWDGGGQMAQQRTPYDLTKAGLAQMTFSAKTYLHQLGLVHLAGMRGDDDKDDWVIPGETHPDFADICINPVLAPTYNRVLYAGEATSVTEMDSSCFLTIRDIQRLQLFNENHARPMPRVVVPNDPSAETDPLGILLVDSWVFDTLQNWQSGVQKDWTAYQLAVGNRGATNPLFKGSSTIMVNGILVKKMPRVIRKRQGNTMTVATSAKTYTESTVTVPTFVEGGDAADYGLHVSIFLGGSALVKIWGRNVETGVPTDLYQGTENDGRRKVMSLGGIGGVGKNRFRMQDGTDTDYGVTVIYSFCGNPLKWQP